MVSEGILASDGFSSSETRRGWKSNMPLYGDRRLGVHGLAGPRAWRPALRLKQRKILPLLPVADFQIESVDLSVLQLEIVIDEEIPEACPQGLVLAKRRQRLAERARQGRRLGRIRRVG